MRLYQLSLIVVLILSTYVKSNISYLNYKVLLDLKDLNKVWVYAIINLSSINLGIFSNNNIFVCFK